MFKSNKEQTERENRNRDHVVQRGFFTEKDRIIEQHINDYIESQTLSKRTAKEGNITELSTKSASSLSNYKHKTRHKSVIANLGMESLLETMI